MKKANDQEEYTCTRVSVCVCVCVSIDSVMHRMHGILFTNKVMMMRMMQSDDDAVQQCVCDGCSRRSCSGGVRVDE
jgi:hypothetical protein